MAAVVGIARSALKAGIIGWKLDIPGGRLYTVSIDPFSLHKWCMDMVKPILQVRIPVLQICTPVGLDDAVNKCSAALAGVFLECVYQHMRESAKVRYSDIVRSKMKFDFEMTRAVLPLPLARIVTSFGPIVVKEGHLAPCSLVPCMDACNGNFGLPDDRDYPWSDNSQDFATALACFRMSPELRTSEIDYSGTEGSAFWTVYSCGVTNEEAKDGFCCLPEKSYSEVDKTLAAMVRLPLFVFPNSQVVPIDWSMTETDVPSAWNTMDEGKVLCGYIVRSAGIQHPGDRAFYGGAELLCAQIVSREGWPFPSGAKRPLTEEGGDSQTVLCPTTKKRIRVGYALFDGCCFSGVNSETAFRLFSQSLDLF